MKQVPLFALPLIENVVLRESKGDVTVTWHSLADSFLYAGERLYLHGYNVYSFSDSSFIPKKASFTQTCCYKDKNNNENVYYTVRGIYRFQGRCIEGPYSKIISISSR